MIDEFEFDGPATDYDIWPISSFTWLSHSNHELTVNVNSDLTENAYDGIYGGSHRYGTLLSEQFYMIICHIYEPGSGYDYSGADFEIYEFATAAQTVALEAFTMTSEPECGVLEYKASLTNAGLSDPFVDGTASISASGLSFEPTINLAALS